MTLVRIVEKSKLSVTQLSYIDQRLKAPVHEGDAWPPSVWNTYSISPNEALFRVF